jgi:hypothetical protein
MFKRVSGRTIGQNVTITIKPVSLRSAIYFVSQPDSNVIHARRDPNKAIKLAYTYLDGAKEKTREIVVHDDQNAWPKNYPPLR